MKNRFANGYIALYAFCYVPFLFFPLQVAATLNVMKKRRNLSGCCVSMMLFTLLIWNILI